MRDDGGGGGGVVLIDPDSLRRAASRLKGIAGELGAVSPGDATLPAMPPGVLAVVQQALAAVADTVGTTPPDLEATVVELTRRAFWAEYSDQLMAGYVLSGPAKQEFYNYLRDGSLLKYAGPEEAAAAGKELALLSNGFQDDQSKLLLMAASLKGVEGATTGENLNAFCGAFVNQFGTKNIEAVPRVIQAMEWGRAIYFGNSTDPLLMRDVARNWTDQDLQTDPVDDLLAPLSLALANATVAGTVTRQFEDEIADNKDTWATATLLSSGVYQKDFLLECFKTGVVQKIADDSRFYSTLSMGELPDVDPYALGRMYGDGHGGLPVDTKSIILDALSRNPEAAAAALNLESLDDPVQVYDRMGNQVSVGDPMTLLYQYGHFEDHGAAFGHAYLAATNELNGDYKQGVPPYDGARADATALTQNALVQMLGSDHDGMSDFKQALAGDLVRHHIGDLYDSAYRMQSFPDPQGVHVSGDESGVANSAVPSGQLELSKDALVKTIDHLAQNDSALNTFLHGSAAYQASLIEANTATPLSANDHPEWAKSIGAFDAAVLGGTGLHDIEQFDASSARHQLVADFFKDAASGVVSIENPVAAAAVHTGIGSAIDSIYPAPDPHDVEWRSFDMKTSMYNSTQAAVTAGYYQNHLVDHAPPGNITTDGTTLKPYGAMADGSDEQTQYVSWMNDNAVMHVTGNAVNEIQNATSRYIPYFTP